MAGIKGMVASSPRKNTSRRKVWQSMRILRRFSVPDLCRTSGAKTNNVRKFVLGLLKHGYVAKISDNLSGHAGSYHAYRLVRDVGPEYPMRCERCGNPLGKKCREEGDER